jgi:xylan 1,4-beta-xylosidase
VDPGLRVGGPATAADGWIDEFLAHTDESGAAVDFVSTHTYGQVPLDLRPLLARHGREGTPLWWTEWGATRSWYGPVNDGVPSAVLLARGMKSAAGRVDAVSYWVASDVFEELGRPQRLLHEGFGLRTIGGLRKPRWWALHLLERLGTAELASRVTGDGAGGMVECWAARDEERDGDPGEVTVALWNGALDQTKVRGAAHLDRDVVVHVDRLPDGAYEVFERRIDAAHSNVCALWESVADGADWPDDDQWKLLRRAERLDDGAPPRRVVTEHGRITVGLTLPSPSMVLLEIVPAPPLSEPG